MQTLFFVGNAISEPPKECEDGKCLWIGPEIGEPCNLNFKKEEELSSHVLNLHLQNPSEPYVCRWQTCVLNSQDETAFEDEKSLVEHVKSHLYDDS